MPTVAANGITIHYDVAGQAAATHAPISEDPETFNRATLEFLLRQR